MIAITEALRANREALDDIVVAAEGAAEHWATPRAPGKWSPSQVVEHVARSLEEGGNVMAGRPTKLPTLPFFVRPLARIFFNHVVRKGNLPKARTNKDMDPQVGLATSAEARPRLEEAFAVFERECMARAAADGVVPSEAFGNVSVADYARFTELHTRHHIKQIVVGR
jgi:hypothetical protein